MYLPVIGAEPLAIVLAGAGILLAAAQDLKTREVPDSLSSGLMVLGFALAGLQVAFGAPLGVLLNSVLGFGFGYAVGALLYFSKQWGGGDAKLLAGIGALLGFFSDPFVLAFGVDAVSLRLGAVALVVTLGLVYLSRHEGRASMRATLIFGMLVSLGVAVTTIGSFGVYDLLGVWYLVLIFLSGAVWAGAVLLYLAVRSGSVFRFDAKTWLLVLTGPVLAAVLIVMFSTIDLVIPLLVYVLAGLAAIAPLLLVVSKRLETVFKRVVEPRELVLGDWLAEDLVDTSGQVVIAKTNPGLSKEQIDRIRTLWDDDAVKRIVIKDGIAFVPAFAIAFAIMLV